MNIELNNIRTNILTSDNEIWKNIPEFEGKYQISNMGRVKSLQRIIGHKNGYLKKEMIIKQHLNNSGYKHVALSINKSKKKTFKIHKLVTICFISNVLPNGFEICHKDGDKHNNIVDNLYIGDHKSNTIDKYIQGRTKLSIDDVKNIIELSKTTRQCDLATKYNVSRSYINDIVNRKCCLHIHP